MLAQTCINNSRAIIITLVTELRVSTIGGRIKFEGEINLRKYGMSVIATVCYVLS